MAGQDNHDESPSGPSTNKGKSLLGFFKRDKSEKEAAFQQVIDALLKDSKLDILLIRMSSVTEDSFHASFEVRITNADPAKAVISPMTAELYGPAGPFGIITLPELTTTAGAAYSLVENQFVPITNMAALKAFVRTAMTDDVVPFSLRGRASISAVKLGPRPIEYERSFMLPGMNGLDINIKAVSIIPDPNASSSADNTGFSSSHTLASTSTSSTSNIPINAILHFRNPTHISLSFGLCEFTLRNSSGEVFAELKGRLDIKEDYFDAAFRGTVNKRVGFEEGQVRLVGRRCAGTGWCDQVIKDTSVPIRGTWKLLQALGLEYEEPAPEGFPKVFKWRGRVHQEGAWI